MCQDDGIWKTSYKPHALSVIAFGLLATHFYHAHRIANVVLADFLGLSFASTLALPSQLRPPTLNCHHKMGPCISKTGTDTLTDNMSNFETYTANNAAFAKSFTAGDKPLPPARK